VSRITRQRLEAGDDITAASLNDRYNDYTQTDINLDNVADGAIDTAQMPSNAVLLYTQQDDIGTGDITFASYSTVNRTTASPPAQVTINNSEVAVNGTTGVTVTSGQVLRVYASLTCRSVPGVGFSAHSPTNMGVLDFQGYSSATVSQVSYAAHGWLFRLEWDITSSALTDWEAVPGQGPFDSEWRSTGFDGEDVSELAGTGLIPLCWAGATAWDDGNPDLLVRKYQNTGWRTVTVSFIRVGSGETVYGLRLRCLGLVHPRNTASVNGLIVDTTSTFNGATPTLDYGPGNIALMHMREP
jgi:hypothetical protein